MKTVLFVPGFREGLAARDYRSVMKAIEGKGYRVQVVPINWARTGINDWAKELDQIYARLNRAETILAGFSYGAMTAFVSAAERNPSELWLFSLSPYFSDDMPHIKKSWLNNIGHRRADTFKKLSFDQLAKNITCKTLLVFGEVEARKHPIIGSRSRAAHKAIKNSRLAMAPTSGHDVADKKYIATIIEAI